MFPSRLALVTATVTCLVLLVTGCGDDDAAVADPPTIPASSDEGDGGDALAVTAVDYGYEGLPDTIEAGTAISLVNGSDSELHELIAIRLADDEERSLELEADGPPHFTQGMFAEATVA